MSPKAPRLIDFSPEEQEVYDDLCAVLREAGVEHLTAGMPLAVIVRTYKRWLDAEAECERDGWTQTSKTGWITATPAADQAQRAKADLSQWLPKACLTIPSLARVRKDTGEQARQDDLFSALVEHATGLPASASKH